MSSIIKWILALSILASAGWGVWSFQTAHNAKPPPTKSETIFEKIKLEGIPAFKLTRLDGSFFEINELKGKVIVLNFWASWCGPCEQEFPSMLNMLKKFDKQVYLIAISIDEKKEDINLFLSRYQDQITPQLIVLHDPTQETPKKFGTFKLPESYIVKPGLQVVDKVVGIEDWTEPKRIEQLRKLINL